MKAIPLSVVVVVVLFEVASAKPSLFHAFPTYYEQLTAPRTNVLHSIKSQFHTQDELGQYSYGYNDGLSSKIESKTTDGITQGSYAYVDSNGIIQNVNYISDDLNGFRVSASNLPVAPTYQFPMHEDVVLAQENPTQIISVTGTEPIVNDVGNPGEGMKGLSVELTENDKLAENANKAATVAAEKQNNITAATTMDKQSESAPMLTQSMPPTVASIIPTYTYQFTPYSLPVYPHNFAAIPLTSFGYHDVAPLSPVYSQFHSQDELGQYSYGYSGGPSSKIEVKTADGITRGGYSYVDANGVLQKVNYIADPINGFRVAATNLPISNMATAYYPTEYHLPEFNLIAHSDKATSLD